MYKDCVNGRVAHKKHIYRFPLQSDIIYGYVIVVSLYTYINIGSEQKFVAFFSLKLYIQYFRQK